MNLAKLRRLRRIMQVLLYAAGVITALGALFTFDRGGYFEALVCVICFCVVAKQGLPEIPPDE